MDNPTIKDIITPRVEIIDDKKDFQDQVNIYDIGSGIGGLENSPDDLFSITFPERTLRRIIPSIEDSLNKKNPNTGFILTGPYGSGKSHSLLVLHHIFENPSVGNEWAASKEEIDGELSIPENSRVASVSAAREGREAQYLWIPIFERLGEKDKLETDDDGYPIPPSVDDLRNLAESRPTAIIIDELHSWYDGLPEKGIRKARNGNFLENLTEATTTHDCPLFVFLSILDQEREKESWQELMDRLDRTSIQKLRMQFVAEEHKLIRYRLFEKDFDKESALEIIRNYEDVYSKINEIDEDKLLKFYPFHPALPELLKKIYGPGGRGEGARRPLRVMANAIKENYESKDLILISDIGIDNLGAIAPSLRDKWDDDIKALEEADLEKADDELIKPITKSIFFYSIPAERSGATEEEIIKSILRPEHSSLDEIRLTLRGVIDNSSFLWATGDRYKFKEEPNVMHTINRIANRIKSKGDSGVKERIKKELEDIFEGNVKVIDIPDILDNSTQFEDLREDIDKKNSLDIIISPESFQAEKEKKNESLKRFYSEFNWPTSVILCFPKSVGSAWDEKIKIKARRVLAEERISEERYNKGQLEEAKKEKEKDIDSLRSRLKDIYGAVVKPLLDGGFREKEIFFDEEMSVESVYSEIVGGPDQVKYIIERNMNEFKEKEVRDIYERFRKILRYGFIGGDEDIYKGLSYMYEEGDIGFESASKYYYKDIEDYPDKDEVWNLLLKEKSDITEKLDFEEVLEELETNLEDYFNVRYENARSKLQKSGGKIFLFDEDDFYRAIRRLYEDKRLGLYYFGELYYQVVCDFPKEFKNWEILPPEKIISRFIKNYLDDYTGGNVSDIITDLSKQEKIETDVVKRALKLLYEEGGIGFEKGDDIWHVTENGWDEIVFNTHLTVLKGENAVSQLEEDTLTEHISDPEKIKEIFLEDGKVKEEFKNKQISAVMQDLLERDPPISEINILERALRDIYENMRIIGLKLKTESYHPIYDEFPEEIRDLYIVDSEEVRPGKIEKSLRSDKKEDIEIKINDSDEILKFIVDFRLEKNSDLSKKEMKKIIEEYPELDLIKWKVDIKRENI